MQYFPEEYPVLAIEEHDCILSGFCRDACPEDVFSTATVSADINGVLETLRGTLYVNGYSCVQCSACVDICPTASISLVSNDSDIWIGNPIGGDSNPGDGSGDENGGGSEGSSPSSIVTVSPDYPITDINDYLKCLGEPNNSNPARLTIYVDQPVPDSRKPYNISNFDVGHSFVSISQLNANGQMITRVFGFYPDGSGNPLTPTKPSILGNNSGHEYDVSITLNLTSSQLQAILGFTKDYKDLNGGNYDLNDFNCTNFAWNIAELAGLDIPQTENSWPLGSGMDPGDFGEDLMKYYGNDTNTPATRNTTGIDAPSNGGSCN